MARTVKITVSTKNHAARGMNLLVNKMTRNAESLVLEAADAAIEAAVKHTPKWSGSATAGWTFTIDKSDAYRQVVENDDMNYSMGMRDTNAEVLNERVISEAKSRARAIVKVMLRQDKRVQMYLVNTVAHSEYWLAEKRPFNWVLRQVNSDYYTMADIVQEANMAYSLMSADMSYRRGGWS